ncbi:MAG TPA: hypothetical protein VNM48_22680 [Chloroflexota bacterium]|nr:hypothetical protein [Chloroflexota bacterium]
MVLVDADLYATIRLLLGEDATSVPDALLASGVITGAAAAAVADWIGLPGYDSRPADEQAAIKTATAYLSAANVVSANRKGYSLTGERYSQQYQWSGAAVDVKAWLTDLGRQAREAVAHLIEATTSTPRRQTMFRLASGRRGASHQ